MKDKNFILYPLSKVEKKVMVMSRIYVYLSFKKIKCLEKVTFLQASREIFFLKGEKGSPLRLAQSQELQTD